MIVMDALLWCVWSEYIENWILVMFYEPNLTLTTKVVYLMLKSISYLWKIWYIAKFWPLPSESDIACELSANRILPRRPLSYATKLYPRSCGTHTLKSLASQNFQFIFVVCLHIVYQESTSSMLRKELDLIAEDTHRTAFVFSVTGLRTHREL